LHLHMLKLSPKPSSMNLTRKKRMLNDTTTIILEIFGQILLRLLRSTQLDCIMD
jgi:hypothetical protein